MRKVFIGYWFGLKIFVEVPIEFKNNKEGVNLTVATLKEQLYKTELKK